MNIIIMYLVWNLLAFFIGYKWLGWFYKQLEEGKAPAWLENPEAFCQNRAFNALILFFFALPLLVFSIVVSLYRRVKKNNVLG